MKLDNSNSTNNLPMQNILRNIIILYEHMIQYAAITDEYGCESITCESIDEITDCEDTEDNSFEQLIYNTITDILQQINLNPHSDEYQNMARYSQETVYGLGLILHQIQCIMDAYANLGIHKIADGYSQPHIQRLFRLVNNMCVIILFFFLIHEDMLDDTYSNSAHTSTNNPGFGLATDNSTINIDTSLDTITDKLDNMSTNITSTTDTRYNPYDPNSEIDIKWRIGVDKS
jgi:hypothetical protein